jgi:CheY-like chemotaxis protein
MKSILFLDDCQTRRRWAAENIHEPLVERHDIRMTLVATAADAIAALSAGPAYDLVYLDHDLDGQAWANPNGENTGSEVVRWILLNKPAIGKVIVHSMNTPAGNRMAKWLKRAGYDAEYRSWLTIVNERNAG